MRYFGIIVGDIFVRLFAKGQAMQPEAQVMGQVAPMGQQVIVVREKSGGPKIFGILAVILGGLGVLSGVMNIGEWDGGLWIVTGALGIISAGMFAYAGVLIFQYQKKGVWMGLGSVGVSILGDLIFTFVVASELGDEVGGLVAGFGMIMIGIKAVCCTGIVALPLMMNGADLD